MLEQMGKAAREGVMAVGSIKYKTKNLALEQIANLLEQESASILAANQLDMAQAQQSGMSEALQDRLLLTPSRLKVLRMMLERYVNWQIQ